ncbi:MAG: ABC transporter substrate-binding protein [Deltaproteobacteria bacterium]|nr:ABC transporter substrate-binding protein [Deltaproteobacteria bacterium]MBW2254779.1 ABC transporter substrate-binding protein [Deltaproteobacteria bacterium]
MAEAEGGGLTTLGKMMVALFVVLLLAAGGYFLSDILLPQGADQTGTVDMDAAQTHLGPQTQEGALEAVDLTGITTVQEYAYVPQERLPAVKGVSSYQWDEDDKILKFPINMWIGWLPIVAANHGFAPNEESVFYKDHGFKVDLTLIDDPVVARDTFAAGRSHVLWGTLDMMVLFAPELMKDSRTAPRIVQQIDWSAGGDGIVVREGIKTVKDLRGKTVVYAQNSPSQYYVNALLISAGVQPAEVKHKYTSSAFEAAAAFVADPSIHACASWAPDIYNIPEKVPNTRILSTTADANKLIADVWAVRADFAKDHPEIVLGVVEGIFKGMDLVQENPAQAAAWMSEGFGLPVEEVNAMMADAHLTNFAENKSFFLNQNNPTNFEHSWESISFVYRELGLIDSPLRFDQVMDFSYIQKLEASGSFEAHKDEYTARFAPQSYAKVTAEAPLLTQELRINFFPNSFGLHEPARDEFGNIVEGKLYDPMVDKTVERAAVTAGQFDRAVIAITGHTDASMKGKVPFEAVQELSELRANSVKQELIDKYKFDENKFVVKGMGWNTPSNADDANNHYLNRRVEIAVYPPEGD